MLPGAKPNEAVCASCAQPLAGRYCSHCGEETLHPDHLTVRHFITHTLAQETLDLDGKLWRTFRNLLFRPAFLTAEYSCGRRRPYIRPLRLLVTAIVLYALLTQGGLQVSLFVGPLVLSVAPAAVPEGATISETVTRIDRFGLLRNLLADKEKSGGLTSEAVREKFHRHLENFAQPLSFANVLLLALVLYPLFRRRRPLFVDHAAFSMHFVSFVLFSSLLFLPVPQMIRAGWSAIVPTAILIVVLWQFAYLAVAIRRFYFGEDQRRIQPGLWAAAAALLLYVLNSAFITGVQLLGGLLALWRI
jgi:hypothetical protein